MFFNHGYEQSRMLAATHFENPLNYPMTDETQERKRLVLGRIKEDLDIDLSIESVFGKPAVSRFVTRPPKPGKRGRMAESCFAEVMQEVESRGLLTVQERKQREKDHDDGLDGPG